MNCRLWDHTALKQWWCCRVLHVKVSAQRITGGPAERCTQTRSGGWGALSGPSDFHDKRSEEYVSITPVPLYFSFHLPFFPLLLSSLFTFIPPPLHFSLWSSLQYLPLFLLHISGTPRGRFIKLGTKVHWESRMSWWFDVGGGQRSQRLAAEKQLRKHVLGHETRIRLLMVTNIEQE